VKTLGQHQIIGRTQRAVTQLLKAKARNARCRARHRQRAPLHGQLAGARLGAQGQPLERRIHGRVGRLAQGRIIDRRRFQPLQPVIAPGIEPHHIEPRLDGGDEGQEELAVDPVLVEIVRRPVRRGHQHHSGGEQMVDQPAQHHGVAHIGDLQLVKA